MRLQIATRLAVYAVLQLAADRHRQLSAGEIAERFGISVNHLSKVLRTLGRAGLVEAMRGAGGGYRFRGDPKRVTLLEVVELFEEVGTSARTQEEQGASSPEGGALRRVLDEIDGVARATMSSITLATLLKLVVPQPPAPGPAAAPRRAARSA